MRRIFSGLAAVVALVAFFAGAATGLVVLVGWPLPAWATLRAAAELHYLPGHLVAQLAACVAWPCLAWLAAAVIRMGVDAWKDQPSHPAGPARWLQPVVRQAVAVLVVSAGLLSRAPAWSAPTTSTVTLAVAAHPPSTKITTRAPIAQHHAHRAAVRNRQAAVAPAAARPAAIAAPVPVNPSTAEAVTATAATGTYRVQPADSLWDIAQVHLHDPLQWRAIWELNRGRVITDRNGGHRVFNDPKIILPGWDLIMPAGWTAPTASPAPAAAAPVPVPVPEPAPPTPVPAAVAPAIPVAPPAATPSIAAPSLPLPALTQPSPASAAGSVNGATARGAEHGSVTKTPPPRSKAVDPVGPMVGVGGVAAAGILWALNRRRREQAFRRPAGAGVPASPPAVETAELQAREIADHEALRWVDLGVRYLGRLIEQLDDPPSVVLVRAGSIGLEIMIDPPTGDAPGRFQSLDGGVTWTLDPTVELAELETLAGDRWPLLPTLVTIGDSPAGTVMANLEHAGSLAVEGDPDRQRGLLTQMLIELTTQPWTDQTLNGVHVLGDTATVADLPGVDIDNDPMTLAQVLDQASDRYQHDIGDAASVAARRAVDSGWEPHVTVAFPDAPAAALRCVIEAAIPDRSGVAVVAAGPVPGARWRLNVQPDGAAILSARSGDRPFEMHLRVDADPDTAELLVTALADSAELSVLPSFDITDGGPLGDALVEEPLREIAVLGELIVVGGPGPEAVEAKRRRPGLAVLAYLATHRQPVPSQDLERALWPLDATKPNLGGVSRATVTNTVAYARKILGRGPNGEELLFFTPEGYRFAEGVTTDWARFQKLVAAAAESDDGSARIEAWTAALRLVNGAPFTGGFPGRYFEWVGSERLIDNMTARIVDVAFTLATAALACGDWDLVRWAVEHGLALAPAREELYQALMHAEGRAGKPDRVQQVYGQLCAMLQREIDVLQTPADTSEKIRDTYTAQKAARR